MKKLLLYPSIFLMAALCVCACHKPTAEVFIPAREFTPASLSVTGGDTVVTISWPASVNSAPGITYTVQISTDSAFGGTPALSFVTGLIKVQVGDDSLADKTKYFVRVKANKNTAGSDSYWVEDTVAFTFAGLQLFKTPAGTDIIDVAAILRWTPTPGVSELTLTDAGGNTTQYSITDAISAAGIDTIYSLKPGTKYSAQLLAGNKSLGSETFTTQASVTGAHVVDLRGIADSAVLIDTLPLIPSGSTVLLTRGMRYSIPSSGYVFQQNVTIMSGLGFGSPAVLSMVTNFDASGSFDSLRFSDLTFETIGSAYLLNVGNAVNINKISIVNCATNGQFSNSLIRLKTAGDVIGTLDIENCIFDSIGVASKYPIIYANASSNAVINNIKIANSTFYYFYYFIREDGVAPASLSIGACTFNNFINQAGYFANYSGTPPSVFNIVNCIFGNTLDPSSSNGIKSSQGAMFSGCYETSDCVFSANPFTGVTNYSGTASALFTDPDNGDFTIKDNAFAGLDKAGDPRWY